MTNLNRVVLFEQGQRIIDDVYEKGMLDQSYDYDTEQQIILLDDQQELGARKFSMFLGQEKLRNYLEVEIDTYQLTELESEFLQLFFNIIRPNVTLNSTITDNALQEELNKLSPFRGSVKRETLIISKGEVVEGEKFKILKSLESEYQSQVWSEANYNWIIFAYTLLVALALLMLLLFFKKIPTRGL